MRAVAAEKRKEQEATEAREQKFWDGLEKSEDPYDNLGDLAGYLHEVSKSTGVYIGELQFPFQDIADDADEQAHLNKTKSEVLKFRFANEDHQALVCGKELHPSKGIAHDALAEDFTAANDDLSRAAENATLETSFKHIYRPEVVRESRMHYWKVPRLGAYMAIPLVYKSALSVNSLQ